MKRVLITGGGGFLGSYVAGALARRDDVELVVSADVRPGEARRRIVNAELDVTKADTIAPLLGEHRIDTVVHLAAIVNPGRNTAREYEVDVEGTSHVLSACVAAGVQRVVVSSSGAAYGYHADSPKWITEDTPLRPSRTFAYSRHKGLVEGLLSAYRVSHPQLEQVVFRIGTILGATVHNQITALWDSRRILRIAGSDSPFVFAWVEDVADAMVRAATDGPAGIYNVAGDGMLTVPEIAARLGKQQLVLPAWLLGAVLWTGRMLRLTPHGPDRIPFLRYRPVLANDLLKSEFGFTPTRTTQQAFEEYLAAHPALARR